MRLDPPGLTGPPPTTTAAAAAAATTETRTHREQPEPVLRTRRAESPRKDDSCDFSPCPTDVFDNCNHLRVQFTSDNSAHGENNGVSTLPKVPHHLLCEQHHDRHSRRLPDFSETVWNRRRVAGDNAENDEYGDTERASAGNATAAFYVSPRSASCELLHEVPASMDSQKEPSDFRRKDILRSGLARRSHLSIARQSKNVLFETHRRKLGYSRGKKQRLQRCARTWSSSQEVLCDGEYHLERSCDVFADIPITSSSTDTSSVSSVDVLVAYTAFNDEEDDPDVQKLCSWPETNNNDDKRKRRFEVDQFAETTSGNETTEVSLPEVHLPETTTCIDLPGGYLQVVHRKAARRCDVFGKELFSIARKENRQFPSGYNDKRERSDKWYNSDKSTENGQDRRRRRCDNTAWLANSITEWKDGRSFWGVEKEANYNNKRATRGRRCIRWNYGFLFVLYFLAWPLLCSTAPTTQLARPASPFAQNVSMDHAANFTRHQERNTSVLSPINAIALHMPYVKDIGIKDVATSSNNKTAKHRYYQHYEDEAGYQGDQSVGAESEWVHPYNEYTWEVNQINPWLSACDLAGPAPADLQGSCGPPGVPKYCPMPCKTHKGGQSASFQEVIEHLQDVEGFRFGRNANGRWLSSKTWTMDGDRTKTTKASAAGDGARTTAPEQCLFYLEESHKRDVCRDDFGRAFLSPRENRYWYISGLRLRHCCEHAVVNALAPGKGGPLEDVLSGGRRCSEALDKLLLVDALAARLHCKFEEVLARYDCSQPYSVIFNCTHCKEAYRKWVCSSLVPYFAHEGPLDLEPSKVGWTGSRIRPCRSICHSVEQRCPYLLPGDRAPAYPTQYAGEPTFLCRDPNIPETGEQAMRTLHSSSDEECCFRFCSEHEPGSGICANCTGYETLVRASRVGDPPTAPNCEILPSQFELPGPQNLDVTGGGILVSGLSNVTLGDTRDSSTWSPGTSTVRGTSLCGGGGVGSVSSSSSSSMCASAFIVPQLVSLCALLVTFCACQDVSGLFWAICCRGLRLSRGGRRPVIGPVAGPVASATAILRRCLQHCRHLVVSRVTVKWCWCRGWWCWCWWWWWISWRRRRKCKNGRTSAECRCLLAVDTALGRRRRREPASRERNVVEDGSERRREHSRRSRRRGRRRRGKPPDPLATVVGAFRFARSLRSSRWTSKKDPP